MNPLLWLLWTGCAWSWAAGHCLVQIQKIYGHLTASFSRLTLLSSIVVFLSDFFMNGKWEQSLLSPGGTGPGNFSASSSPMSTLSSNYRGAGGSFNTEVTTTYLSGPGRSSIRTLWKWREIDPKHQGVLCHDPFLIFPPVAGSSHRPNMSGGVHTSDVTLRKRSENRVYTEENIRDSIVMGELASKFPDFGTL